MRRLALAVGLAAALAAAAAGAQQSEPPNSVLLVARPELPDPNFRDSVVLVTQRPDGSTVGVILNRPTPVRLEQLLPDLPPAANYRDRVYFGGPVMQRAIVALFRAPRAPEAPAFHVMPDIYLSMHPHNLEQLLSGGQQGYRLYAGFAGWAPRQLEGEFGRDDWYVLAPTEELLFRDDTSGMWRELITKARGGVVRKREAPREAGL